MRSKFALIIILAFILASASFPPRTRAQIRPVVIAPGFEFSLFADAGNVTDFRGTGQAGALAGPTSMAFDSSGRLFVGTYLGKILILLDSDEDGRADQVKTFASNIPVALGLEFHPNGDLYATSNILGGAGRVLRLRDTDGDDVADEITTLVDGLPSEGDHQTDRLKFGPDGMLYVGQGSSTDDGNAKPGRAPERPLNATVFRIDVDNPVVNIFATGLRNPFGMAFHPENGQLFTTDGGSGEVCQNIPTQPPCPEVDPSPPEEINWVTAGSHYGFPFCEGTPAPENPNCATTRAPVLQYPQHLTPTALAFYTGPQAGELKNHLLLTLYKRLINISASFGGDLRVIKIEGDAVSGFQLQDVGFIARFEPIDPFDGPVEMAIDPISGDIYVARFDPVSHRDPTEHHHIIYRIHREGSDSLPFIAKPAPQSVTAGSGMATINLIGRHLKPGAVALADGVPVTTHQGATRFDLIAEIPASMTATEREITIEVQNPDSARSNQQTFTVRRGGGDTGTPALASLFVYKKKRDRIVDPVVAGSKAKKFRIVVAGASIDSGAELFVGGQSLEVISVTATEIVGRLKNSIIASPGLVPVQVRNPNGKTSNTINLVVVSSQ
ncbi:MAG: PQQ-dependent sugar dehydrogenase [Acidobacteriota bacterium]